MPTCHVRKGDEVVVTSGSERGKRGKVINVQPGKNRLIIEGVKLIKRHMKKSAQHPEGTIVEREGAIHASNVIKAALYDARAASTAQKNTNA